MKRELMKRLEEAEQKAKQGNGGGCIIIADWTDEELQMLKEATGEPEDDGTDNIRIINIHYVGPGDPLEAPPRPARPLEELLKLWEIAKRRD